MTKRRIRVRRALLALLFLIPIVLVTAGWTRPAAGPSSSAYGWRYHPKTGEYKKHQGEDIAAAYGDPVYAAAAGQVIQAWDRNDGYGNTIVINHMNGYFTRYAHLSAFFVADGQIVQEGQLIGRVGDTGVATGPHLHFEIRIGNEWGEDVNPADYIPGLGTGEPGSGGSINDPMMEDYANYDWEVANDFASSIKEIIDKLVDLFTQGLKILQNTVADLFFVLCCIDIALGAMKIVLTPESDSKETLLHWIVRRSLFYGFCLVFLYNWNDFIGNLSLHGFPVLGGYMGGDLEGAAAAVSDPTNIIQKGMSIISPLYNAALHSTHGSIFDVFFSTMTPLPLIVLVGAGVLFILFCFIGLYIAIAYLQFYATVLFSLAAFPLAGTAKLRHFASNGINGVIAASINLMFICFFAAQLQATLAEVSIEGLVSTSGGVMTAQDAGTSGMSGSAVDAQLNDLGKAQIKEIYNELLGLGYTPAAALGICGNIAQESQGDPTCGMENPNGPSGIAQWTWERRDDLVARASGDELWTIPYQVRFLDYEMIRDGYKDAINAASSPAEAAEIFYRKFERAEDGTGGKRAQIATELANGNMGTGMARGTVRILLNFGLLLILILVVLKYMYFCDCITKLINRQFGNAGFHLSKNEGIFSR